MTVRDLIILGCSSQQPTRKRNQGAYLVRWNTEGFLFDPGEGTQRQFIFANIAPPTVTRIFVSHFHGDHCLGLGSMLMRLNLDQVTHPIHCYYPASGKKYFDRLRYGTIYHERVQVIEHPVHENGLVHDDGRFRIEAAFLNHGTDTLGWRIQEASVRKFDGELLETLGIRGPLVRQLCEKGELWIADKRVTLDDISHIRQGDVLAVVMDTLPCQGALEVSRGSRLLICESTYLEEHRELARRHNHLTAKQAAQIALEGDVGLLVLTHFSARYLDTRPFREEASSIFPRVEVAEDLKIFPFPRL